MHESVPEVSVIVPIYNVTPYIAAALDSVFSQTFQDFEIVLVNDGCPDTVALERALEPYQARIRYIKQTNKGVSAARNTAVRAACAPLVLLLDSDDLLEPGCVEEQVGFMRAHPEYGAAYCNNFMFGEGPKAGRCWMDIYPTSGPVSFVSIMEGQTGPAAPGSIFRRDTLLRIGLYDESLRAWEDFDVMLRIVKSEPPGQIGYTRRPLVRYRQRSDSLTNQSFYAECALAVLEKAARCFELSSEEASALHRRIERAQFALEKTRGKRAMAERRWKDAIRSFEYCQQYQPARKTQATLWLLRTFPWTLPVGTRAWNYYLKRRRSR